MRLQGRVYTVKWGKGQNTGQRPFKVLVLFTWEEHSQ